MAHISKDIVLKHSPAKFDRVNCKNDENSKHNIVAVTIFLGHPVYFIKMK